MAIVEAMKQMSTAHNGGLMNVQAAVHDNVPHFQCIVFVRST
jgi:hypothetical protein